MDAFMQWFMAVTGTTPFEAVTVLLILCGLVMIASLFAPRH